MTVPEVKSFPFDVADFLPWEAQERDPLSLARAGVPDAADNAIWNEDVIAHPESEGTPV